MIPRDKKLHLLVGFVIGAIVTALVTAGSSAGAGLIFGLSIVTIIAAAKEFIDSEMEGNVSMQDFIATFAGGVVGCVLGCAVAALIMGAL
jgi:VanZ family protein